MDKVTGVAFGLRLAAAFTIASTLSACLRPPRPSTPELTRIVIDDDWDGYSSITPVRSHWVVEPAGTGFILYGTHSQQHIPLPADQGRAADRDVTNVPPQVVPTSTVDALLRAMRAPPQPSIDLAVFGPTVNHAAASIDETVQSLTALGPPAPLQQRIVNWGNDLRQPQRLADAIKSGMATYHTDDYPLTRVEASFADGSRLVSSSDSQNVLMLPWRDTTGRKSFSADLPRALAALLPPVSTNHMRLSGPPSQEDFDDALRKGIAKDYHRFKMQILMPAAYASIQTRLVIDDVDLDNMAGADGTTLSSLFIAVKIPGGPPNLSLMTPLQVKGGALATPEDLGVMTDELDTVVGATALRQAMQTAPSDAFRILRDSGMPSFEASEKKRFIARMGETHKLPELVSHPELLDGAVMVTEDDGPFIKGPRSRGSIYWVALRDQRTVALTRLGVCKNSDDCIVKVYDSEGKAL
ncbi:hypothetical protein [Luteibacter sp. dw_328]|uniref:hypothetical protein n=1 Tax=Luteibacter sp. dw_328 TaxID=2719796 RepID=UPI001BD2825D|nr:hypothetical protein [Luteibacter sp. dw_328]